MRNTFKTSMFLASLLAASALTVSAVRAEPMNGGVMKNTIQVDDGKGGWKPYVPPPKPPAGPTGVSVVNDKGDWVPYNPPPKPPAGPTGISVVDDKGDWVPYNPPVKPVKAPRPIRHKKDQNGWTYYLAQDRNNGQLFIQVEDANGNDVHINGSIPMPGGGGTLYPVR